MKIRLVFFLMVACFPFLGQAMEQMRSPQKNAHLAEKCAEQASLKSVQKSLIVMLTKEDAHQILAVLNDDLFQQVNRAYFEKNLMFLKHCLFVMAKKKEDYSPQALEARLAATYLDPVYQKLDDLLKSGKNLSVSDTLSFFAEAFHYDWQQDIPRYNTYALCAEDAALIWTLELRFALSTDIDNQMFSVVKKLCKSLHVVITPDQQNRSVKNIKTRLEKISADEKIAEKKPKDEVSARLYDLVFCLSDRELKYCIFLLSRPSLYHELMSYNFFFRVYFHGVKKASEKNDPELVRMLFDLLGEHVNALRDTLCPYLSSHKDFSALPKERRERLEAFLHAIRPVVTKRVYADNETMPDNGAKPQPEGEPAKKIKTESKPLCFDDLSACDEPSVQEKIRELLKDATRLPQFQELLFQCIVRLQEENKTIPLHEAKQSELTQRAEKVSNACNELAAQVMNSRLSYESLRADVQASQNELQKQLCHLTLLLQKSQVPETKDIHHE